jgi:hypothetical protein
MVEGSSLIHDGYIGTLCSSRYLVVAVAQLLQGLTYPLRCVRGPERHGTTQLHPEPGRAPWQRRRVLRGELRGRRGRCAHTRADMSICVSRILMHRGVEQRQLVGLITQRSRVRIPPPLPRHPRRIPPAGVSVCPTIPVERVEGIVPVGTGSSEREYGDRRRASACSNVAESCSAWAFLSWRSRQKPSVLCFLGRYWAGFLW